jgi:energy-converting hydrogenase Eha subunit A
MKSQQLHDHRRCPCRPHLKPACQPDENARSQPRESTTPEPWEVTYSEKPPGALVPVLTMTLSATVISLVLSVTLPRIATVDLNAPTLALAVPIFAITLFGFSFDRLFRSSLQAVYGFISAAILTVFVTVIAVFGHPPTWSMVDVASLQIDYILVGCFLAGLATTCWLSLALRSQFRYYRQRILVGAANPWRRNR